MKKQVSNEALLKFGKGSAKLADHILHFSIPTGFSCTKFARSCLAFADKDSGKIKRGPDSEFTCYYASLEGLYPSVRKNSWHNWELLKDAKTTNKMASLIQKSLIPLVYKYHNEHLNFPTIRIHVGGEFYSRNYWNAWLKVARELTPIKFYAYTKAISYWVRSEINSEIPDNLNLTASFGGLHDAEIIEYGLKYNKVVFSKAEAAELKLPIDHNDWYAHTGTVNFASLLHGVQAKGSKASAAISKLKKEGFTGYGKNKDYSTANPALLEQCYKWHKRIGNSEIQSILEQLAA